MLFRSDEKQLEVIRKSLRNLNARPNDRLTFSLEGLLLVESDAWYAWWQKFRLNIGTSGSSKQRLSVVSGESVATTRTHPKVKMRGALRFGAAIVSFNEQAFESFGLRQGAHSPFSPEEASAYQVALNTLLETAPTFGSMRILHWYG